ncbi:hypothetical protein BG011_000927, partial [Mortierella polycephala]
MYGPSKLVALFGLIAAAAAAVVPLDAAATNAPLDVAVKPLNQTGKMSANVCNIHYEV